MSWENILYRGCLHFCYQGQSTYFEICYNSNILSSDLRMGSKTELLANSWNTCTQTILHAKASIVILTPLSHCIPGRRHHTFLVVFRFLSHFYALWIRICKKTQEGANTQCITTTKFYEIQKPQTREGKRVSKHNGFRRCHICCGWKAGHILGDMPPPQCRALSKEACHPKRISPPTTANNA